MGEDDFPDLSDPAACERAEGELMAICRASYLIGLEKMTTHELAVLNNSVAFGMAVPQTSLAFQPAVVAHVINPDGTFHDLLRDALAFELRRRLDFSKGSTP